MNRIRPLLALVLLASPLVAQTRPSVSVTPRTTMAYTLASPNAARLGITMGSTGAADTDGVLVDDVTADGPAAKAGIKAGDRIQSINGVNLKLDPSDRDDPSLAGMMQRRLQREMAKHKPGDDIALRVLSGGSTKNVTVKAVAERELVASTVRAPMAATGTLRALSRDRAALGISLGGSPSKRDTAGVLVIGVNTDGPAEKAGIIEGDRIARINGVDLRVPREDAGDPELWQARLSRLTRTLNELEAGATATLTVVSGGRSREVRVTTVKASELGGGMQMFFGESMMPSMIRELEAVRERLPAIRGQLQGPVIERRPEGSALRYSIPGVEVRTREAFKRVQESLEQARAREVYRRVIKV